VDIDRPSNNMVYQMEFYVDGGCRGNGTPSSIGAAAACLKLASGVWRFKTLWLPSQPSPTNQRAELHALILGQEWALEHYDELGTLNPLEVTIHSDSNYAVACMDEWRNNWVTNGWKNSHGGPVANRDLIEKAYDYDYRLHRIGNAAYVGIRREENAVAHGQCQQMLNG
jgi:ribonuclease HI